MDLTELMVTVWREQDGWRVSDEDVSEVYANRSQALARAQDLADACSLRGAQPQLFIETTN